MLAAQISSNTEFVYGHWDDEPVTSQPDPVRHPLTEGRLHEPARPRRDPRPGRPARRPAHQEARPELRRRRQHRAPHRQGRRRRSRASTSSRSARGSARSPSACSRPGPASSPSRSTSASPSSCRRPSSCCSRARRSPSSAHDAMRDHRPARRPDPARREPAVQHLGAGAAALARALPSIRAGVVMVQAEVGQRLAAEPGSKVYGSPSVKASWYGAWRTAGQGQPPGVLAGAERRLGPRRLRRAATSRSAPRRSASPPSARRRRLPAAPEDAAAVARPACSAARPRRRPPWTAAGVAPTAARRAAHRARLPARSPARQSRPAARLMPSLHGAAQPSDEHSRDASGSGARGHAARTHRRSDWRSGRVARAPGRSATGSHQRRSPRWLVRRARASTALVGAEHHRRLRAGTRHAAARASAPTAPSRSASSTTPGRGAGRRARRRRSHPSPPASAAPAIREHGRQARHRPVEARCRRHRGDRERAAEFRQARPRSR